MTGGEPLLDFLDDMRRLRRECPWKREQTHRSLARYLEEETSETLEAIETGDADHLREELGDLLLQVYFHSVIAEESGDFTLDDVARGISEKMHRRNPHVFGPDAPSDLSVAEVNQQWQAIKQAERVERLGDPMRRRRRRTTGSRAGCLPCCSPPRSSNGVPTPPRTCPPPVIVPPTSATDCWLSWTRPSPPASIPSRPSATPYAAPFRADPASLTPECADQAVVDQRQTGGSGSYWIPRRTSSCTVRAGQSDHEVQGHVDAGADAGGGDHVAVVDPAGLGPYVDRRVGLGEPPQRVPVRRGRAVAEETGMCVDQRPRAHAGQQRHGLALPTQPVQVVLIGAESPDVTARLDQHRELGHVLAGVVGRDDEALVAGHGPAVGGERRAGVPVLGMHLGPVRQHLPRTDRVELLDPVEQQDADVPGRAGRWRGCGHAASIHPPANRREGRRCPARSIARTTTQTTSPSAARVLHGSAVGRG